MRLHLEIHGSIALKVIAELIVVAGQDGVKQDARDSAHSQPDRRG